MAVAINLYNHTPRLLVGQEIDLTSVKIILLNSSGTFNAAHTTLDQVAGANTPPRANEVSGNGWTTGGIALANVTVTTVTTNDGKLDADDVIVTATGGSIGPARYAVAFDDSHANKVPIFHVDFDQNETAGEDTDFRIVWNADGIIPLTYA